MAMLNLMALVSTDPVGLYDAADPVGPETDHYIRSFARDAGIVVVCWGNHAAKHTTFWPRAQQVLAMIRRMGKETFHLGLTSLDAPRHPSRLPNNIQPLRFSL